MAVVDSIVGQILENLSSMNMTVPGKLAAFLSATPLAGKGSVISLIVAGSVFAVVLLFYVIRTVQPVTPFIYSNARIQAKSNIIITESRLRELANSRSLRELANSIKDSDYGDEIDKVNVDYLQTFHSALELGFRNAVMELHELSPDKFKPVLEAYMNVIEAKILRTIYRAKSLKTKLDEKLIFSIGNITPIVLKHLVDAQSVADLGVVLADTIYKDIFLKEYKSIEEFDVALDAFVLENIISVAENSKMYDARYIIDVINKRIDILNLQALLKFRIRELDTRHQKKLLINNHSLLMERVDHMIHAKTMHDFVNKCKGLYFHKAMVKALEKYDKDEQYSHFEFELSKFYKEFVVGADLHHTLGPYPLFSYLTKKEFELRNLFVVSRGVDANLDKTKEMVI